MDGHINFRYKPLRGLDSRGQSSRLFGPFASSEYMRQAQAACAEDEYPICLALFADGVNVKKNLEAHPIFCTLMNYDDKTRMSQRCMRLVGIIPALGNASRYTKEEVRMRNMEIIHHSFTYVLARFNELHDVAKERVCPDGRRRKTRLFLCMIPGDNSWLIHGYIRLIND